jgi:hypothetical protein
MFVVLAKHLGAVLVAGRAGIAWRAKQLGHPPSSTWRNASWSKQSAALPGRTS